MMAMRQHLDNKSKDELSQCFVSPKDPQKTVDKYAP